jgi:hypothetical protein
MKLGGKNSGEGAGDTEAENELISGAHIVHIVRSNLSEYQNVYKPVACRGG